MPVPVSVTTEHKDLRDLAAIPLVGGVAVLVLGLTPQIVLGMLLSDIPVRLILNSEFFIMTPLSLIPVGPFGTAWDAVLRIHLGVKIKILWLPVWLLSWVYTAMGIGGLLYNPDQVTVSLIQLIPAGLLDWFAD